MSENKLNTTIYKPGILVKLLLSIVVAITALYLLVSIFYPADELLLSFGPATLTPTMTQTEVYETPTPRATFTPTITVTPTITNTPFPASKFNLPDFSDVRPQAPLGAEAVYIIDNLDAEVNPPFDHYQWTSSDTISAEIERDLPEQYFATFGAGSIRWSMDQSLPPGLYEIYILDTLYSSGGYLNYTVALNYQPLQPMIGRTLLQYDTTQSEPPQYQDEWRSIGIYDIQQLGILSVATEWGNRDELSIVAMDRIMIVKRSENVRVMLSKLPNNGSDIYIIDDEEASFSTSQYWSYWEDEQTWNAQYQVMSEPPLESSVTWRLPALLTHGQLEVYAWIPKANASIPVAYKLHAGGLLLQQDDGTLESEFADGQGLNQAGQWIKLGNWTIPEHFGNFVRIEIILTIPASDTGEAVIDAIAVLHTPSQVPEE